MCGGERKVKNMKDLMREREGGKSSNSVEGKRNYGGRGRVVKKTRVVIGVNQQGRE